MRGEHSGTPPPPVWKLLSKLSLCLLVAACGRIGFESPQKAHDAQEAADGRFAAKVVYPPGSVATTAEFITLRGSWSGPDVTKVTFSAAGVSIPFDGTEPEWSLQVPLSIGPNEVSLVFLDDSGAELARSASSHIRRIDVPLESPRDIAIETDGSAYYIVDPLRGQVMGFSPTTKERWVVSGANIGGGPVWGLGYRGLGSIATCSDRPGALYVTSYDSSWRIIEVNVATGDRRIVTDSDVHAGVVPAVSEFLHCDVVGNRFLTPDSSATNGVIAIDRDSGERRIQTSNSTTGGEFLNEPVGVAQDSANARILIADVKGLIASDEAGLRSPVSGQGIGTGPAFDGALDVLIDSSRNRAIVTSFEAVYAVDLVTGNRTLLSGLGVGSGPEIETMWGAAYDATRDTLVVIDIRRYNILQIDLSTGDRLELELDNLPVGEVMVPSALIVAPDTKQLLLLDRPELRAVELGQWGSHAKLGNLGLGSIYTLSFDVTSGKVLFLEATSREMRSFDMTTGSVELVASDTRGTGASLTSPRNMSSRASKAYVSLASEVVEVDLATGDRVSLASRSAGPLPFSPLACILLSDQERLFVVTTASNDERVDLVRLSTGEREIFSESPLLTQINGATEGPNNSLYFVDSVVGRIVSLDTGTAEAKILTGPLRGTGPSLLGARYLVFEPTAQILYVSRGIGVVAVDVVTGERVELFRR